MASVQVTPEIDSRDQRLFSLRYLGIRILVYLCIALYLQQAQSLTTNVEDTIIYYYIGLTLLFSAGSLLLTTWLKTLKSFVILQLFADIVFATYLVWLVGLSTPIASCLYVLVILVAELEYQRNFGYITASISTLCLTSILILLTKFTTTSAIDDIGFLKNLILVNGLVFFLVAVLASGISKRLKTLVEDNTSMELLQLAIFQHSPAGFIVLKDNVLEMANPAAKSLCPDIEALITQLHTDTTHEQFLETSTGPISYIAIRLPKKKTLVTFHSTAEVLKAEQQLAKEQEMAKIGLLSSNLAHDFRNALSTIYGPAQVLQELLKKPDSDSAMISSLLELIVDESQIFSKKISAFIQYATPTHLQLENLLCEDVLDASLKKLILLEEWSDSHFIEASLQTKETLFTNHRELVDCLTELLFNACIHSSTDNSIIFNAKNDDCWVTFEVINDCHKELTELEVQPFYTTQPHRSGLGLARVAKVSQALGWNFEQKQLNQQRIFQIQVKKKL